MAILDPPSTAKSISWKLPSAEECCKKHLTGPLASEFSYWFCMSTCIMCCAEVVIDLEVKKVGFGFPGSETPADEPGDLPVNSVQDGELSFTTSQYGSMIPIVFGSDKLTGNVFWASPIKRNSVTIDGEAQYYNTVSFAFGICEGEINGVLRMWVGDKLILDSTMDTDDDDLATPGASGFIAGFQVDLTDETSPLRKLADNARRTKVTVFTGSETQIPEGIIVDAEGYESTPAYRGLAYVLFENFIIPSGSIPNLFVEVTSNTDNKLPRVYGDIETTDELDTMQQYALLVDPAFDQVTVVASGSGGRNGYVTFDYNRLEELVVGELSVKEDIGNADWANSWVTKAGLIVFHQPFGNNGKILVYNPFSGSIVDTLGPGGSIFAHSMTTGFGNLCPRGCVFTAASARGMPGSTIYCGVGFVNHSVGFAEIAENGQITMRSVLNGMFPYVNGNAIDLKLDAETAKVNPRFADNAVAQGQFVYVFSARDNEAEEISVQRIDATDVDNPTFTTLPALPVSLFNGSGISHTLYRVAVDPTDNCILMLISCPIRPARMVKWSPFTGQVVWSIALASQLSGVQGTEGGLWSAIPYSKWAYIDITGDIYTVDLTNGAHEMVVDGIGTQGLPPTTGQRQFYNGFENSITYRGTIAGQRVTKVFIDRLVRQTVDLSSIVTNLLKRQGVTDNDIAVEDLSALTLNGYTIREVKTLRAAFSELGQAFTYDVVESNGKIKFKTRGDSAVEVFNHKHVGADAEGWLKTSQVNEAERARKINLTYRDLDREYSQNVQSIILGRISNQAYDPDAAIDVDVPIVLQADSAKRLAEILLYGKMVGNRTYDATLPPRARYLDPADVIGLQKPNGEVLTMRIREMTVGGDRAVKVSTSQEDPDIYTDQVNLFGTIGRFERDGMPEVSPRVDPFLMAIPGRSYDEIEDSGTNSYLMFIAWLNLRNAAPLPTKQATLVVDTTDRYTVDPPSGFPTWGYIITPPTAIPNFNSTDYTSTLRVRLVSTGFGEPESAPGGIADLMAAPTVNLALVGQELIQFATATQVDDDIWDLTVLHRVRMGTDPGFGNQEKGDRFILLGDVDGILDNDGISVVNIPIGAQPRKIVQIFLPTGSPFQPAPILNYVAQNLRPVAVANIEAAYVSTDAVISWKRRARYAPEWPDDGSEVVPLNEAAESYELYLFKDVDTFSPNAVGTYMRKVTVTSPTFTYTAAMQTADGFDRNTEDLYWLVYQTGSHTSHDNGVGTYGQLVDL